MTLLFVLLALLNVAAAASSMPWSMEKHADGQLFWPYVVLSALLVGNAMVFIGLAGRSVGA